MENEDIQILKDILIHKGRNDLANLLKGSHGDINETTQYGSYLFSTISTYEITAPLKQYYKLKKINNNDRKFILDAILDIYPQREHSPEIVAVEFLMSKENVRKDVAEPESISNDKIRFFISYCEADKHIAGEIKSKLESCGFVVFLAHEDIMPSEEWQKTILTELKNCDIFVPILTDNFAQSEWTDQETGIAFSDQKLIIPLKIGADPYGFISKYQALKININDIETVIKQIKDVLLLKGNKYKILNSLIDAFSKSDNFAEANNKIMPLMEHKETLTDEQILKIIEAGFNNGQIYDEKFKAGPFVQKLFVEHWDTQKELILGIAKTTYPKMKDDHILEIIKQRFHVEFE